ASDPHFIGHQTSSERVHTSANRSSVGSVMTDTPLFLHHGLVAGLPYDQNNPSHEHHGYHRSDIQVWGTHVVSRFVCFVSYCRFALASFTRNARPPNSLRPKARHALSASLASVISTNAKPFGRPVSLSITIFTRSTAPCTANKLRSCGSVVLWGRLPT